MFGVKTRQEKLQEMKKLVERDALNFYEFHKRIEMLPWEKIDEVTGRDKNQTDFTKGMYSSTTDYLIDTYDLEVFIKVFYAIEIDEGELRKMYKMKWH